MEAEKTLGQNFIDVMGYLMKKFEAGGPIMWVLLALSIVGLAFVLDRILVLTIQNMKMSPNRFLKIVAPILNNTNKSSEEKVDEIIKLCESKPCMVTNVMIEAATKWKEAKHADFNMLELKSYLQSNVDEKSLVETPVLEARMGGLASCASLAPLVGLLGTVMGMIQSFDVMANSPAGAKPNELAGGISVALITTAGGLIVAIPIIMLHGFLKSLIDGKIGQLEDVAKQFVDELVRLA